MMITKKHFSKTTGGEKQSDADPNILILQQDKETLIKHLKVNPLIIWPLTPPGGNTENGS